MDEKARQRFNNLHAKGMKLRDRYPRPALTAFQLADETAADAGDERMRLNALNPMARALWHLGRYDEAAERLKEAKSIAEKLTLIDESAIAVSNLGRLAAVQVVETVAVEDQGQQFRIRSVPHFAEARKMLSNHPHYYFRYANAQHGAGVAALAGVRQEAANLIADGMSVAFSVSPQPYDQVKTSDINPRGLEQMATALAYLAHGDARLAEQLREQIR